MVHRWTAVVGLFSSIASALAIGLAATPGHAASPAACGKLLPPQQGVYFGAAPGYANEDQYWPGPEFGFDLDAGLKAVWTMFGQWWSDTLPFPTKAVESIWRDGKVPYLRLNPYPEQPLDVDYNGMPPGPFTLEDIAAGRYDAQIRAWADTARNLDIPILVEFGTEVNNFFPWSPLNNGAGTTTGYGNPSWPDGAERFRDAFRHVVTLSREEGATNITWFFHADTVYYWAPQSWDELRWTYPGDDYVDWLGLSLYAFPRNPPDTGYTTFAEKLQTYHQPGYVGSYDDITSLSSRPLAIVEMGFNKVPVSARPAWVADAAATIKSGAFSRLAGLTWYVVDGGDYDDQVDASPEFKAAFRKAFDDPYFAARPTFSGNCTPLPITHLALRGHTLSWTAVPNAASYEIWRGTRKVAVTTTTSAHAARRGVYRVRAVNLTGFGTFATAH